MAQTHPKDKDRDEGTPIRRQYLELKRRYADSILFFRLGDFYETFDQDAELIARELDIVLTSRPVAKDTRIPMAGVPHHAADGYIARLIERGYRVAIAEQLGSEPVNGLVPREVRQVITPGTVVEPGMLSASQPNYLAAVLTAGDGGQTGLAYCDITTGEFRASQLDGASELERELARIQPREVLVPESGDIAQPAGANLPGRALTQSPFPAYRFEIGNARQTLQDHFQVATLAGFDLEDKPLALRAAGAIVAYLRETQPAALRQLADLQTYLTSHFMGLDAVTRRNLELVEPLRAGAKGRGGLVPTLLGVLDRTATPMGARLLRTWISQPLVERDGIERRLRRVDALFSDALLRARALDGLKHMPDLERLTNRTISGIAAPKDLLNIKAAAAQWLAARALIAAALPDLAAGNPDKLAGVIGLVESALKAEPDDDEGFIRPGYSPELDSIHDSARGAKAWVANLERSERDRTGIRSLKVGYNKVFGYYIEITHANTEAAPADYIRKQTLTNAERYITPELKEYETLILNADERIAETEARLLKELNQTVAAHSVDLLNAAQSAARLDVAASLAESAARGNYTRPVLTGSGGIAITAGRHPVIEQLLTEIPFTPNDTALDDQARVLVITGPNMSGKSSYMRQVALITLMAQIGSYVPAKEARITPVDRIFTRIGAQDELTAGQSTFMVEMVETANILRHCTPRSLVILDEIGRGTSTYDGLAIAWSVIEFLHNHPERRAMTLFATHYHELIKLSETLPHVRNYNVAVSDEGGQVAFLHKVVPGGADRSYGVHVAQLAGLPGAVVHRAQDLLAELEAESDAEDTREPAKTLPSKSSRGAKHAAQIALFAEHSPALDRLKSIDPNSLSPLEALTALFELKKLL